jgi:uncharacterized membrane protein (UPF0127 family)
MSKRPRAQIIGAGLILLGVVVVGRAAAGVLADDEEPPSPAASMTAALAGATPAAVPFAGLTETRVDVGDRRLRVVLADDEDERVQGLRARDSLGPYDGMLFAYPGLVESRFTMSTVPIALDIGFYDAAGRVVDHLHMKPCAGSERECPAYAAAAPFVYALETPAGSLPSGRLRAAVTRRP